MKEVVAALRKVTKAYPGTLAARGVSIEFRSGEIHALLGENGAGKSTLVKILAGLLQPDSGKILIDGLPVRLGSTRASQAHGIGVVHQAGSLIDTLTVEENLRLAKLTAPASRNERYHKVAQFTLPPQILPQRFVYELSPHERQLVEIHRLLTQKAHLLILDEPTATLSPHESSLLFRELRVLAKAGYSILVVSHKLPELLAHCHRFTVLRNGQVVSRLHRSMVSAERLIKLLNHGEAPSAVNAPKVLTTSELKLATLDAHKVLLHFKKVSAACTTQEPALQNLNLTLSRGEILGIVGRAGSGVSSLLKILQGESAPTAGRIEWADDLAGQDTKPTVGYVPADRINNGVIQEFTIGENLSLRRRNYLGRIRTAAHIKEGHSRLAGLISRFNIHPPQPQALVGTLSGGNVQKVLLAREMEYTKTLLLAESPTAGLDIASAAFVRLALRRKADSGTCIVVHSNDLDELILLSDRIVVFSAGRIISEFAGGQMTSDMIGKALAGIPRQELTEQPKTVSGRKKA